MDQQSLPTHKPVIAETPMHGLKSCKNKKNPFWVTDGYSIYIGIWSFPNKWQVNGQNTYATQYHTTKDLYHMYED